MNAEQEIRALLADRNLRFPVYPRLVGDLSFFSMPDGLGIQVRGAEMPVLIRGRYANAALSFLRPLLDGKHTLDDLLQLCPATLERVTLLRTLLLLHGKGILAGPDRWPSDNAGDDGASRAHDEVMRRQLLFWGRKIGVTRSAGSVPEVQRRLQTSRLVLIATGLFGAATYDLLVRCGSGPAAVLAWDEDEWSAAEWARGPLPPRHFVHLPSTSVDEVVQFLWPLAENTDLLVVATRHASADLYRVINRICLDRGCPWLRANEDGWQVEIGPYVRPHRSACFRCLELRQASAQNFAIEEHLYQEHLARPRPAGETLPAGEILPITTLGASLVVLEGIRIVTGLAAPTLLNAVLTVDPLSGSFQSNGILRVPRCPECGRGASSEVGTRE
jgi:bacteriocin biosynthesis cyclodehydratase domain-containing protein